MPRPRHERGDVLQVAFEIRRHGCVVDGAPQGTGRREPPAQKDVCGRTPQSRDHQGSLGKKGLTPSCRREMAQEMVRVERGNIRVVCAALGISRTCYRYQCKLSTENAEIAAWLIRLTNEQKNWGFGLCYLYLRNVQGFRWNHK